ncbi:MAG: hypothetical protein WC822_06200 [Candidatus Paceibacterota bacterium]
MEQKISILERAFKVLIESKDELIKDAKLKNYNPFSPNPIMFFSLKWWKNIIKMLFSFLIVFVFSPNGMFLDLKEGRIKNFLFKLFFLLFISIPFGLIFLSFCFLILVAIITPIIVLLLYFFYS